jgi:hypothetical protein
VLSVLLPCACWILFLAAASSAASLPMDQVCAAGKRLSVVVPKGSPRHLSGDLPKRSGARPDTNPCLPHDQRSQNAPRKIWTQLLDRVFASEQFADASGPHQSLVSLPSSQALFMKPGASLRHAMVGREFAHVHGEHDGSLHLLLSPADAKFAVDQEWAELHLLAGEHGLPPGLVMVYAPRDEAELEIIVKIIEASYVYAKQG